jgi:hypothetical protein
MKDRTVDNVQNCDSYINIPYSQSYRLYSKQFEDYRNVLKEQYHIYSVKWGHYKLLNYKLQERRLSCPNARF